MRRLNWGIDWRNKLPIGTPFEEVQQTHVSLLGKTGSGKSVLAQHLIAQYNANPDYCVVVLDAGMNNALHAVTKETARHKEYAEFFADPNLDGLHLDPVFLPDGDDTVLPLASHATQSMNIESGLEYGAFYFYMSSFAAVVDASLTLKKKGLTPNLNNLVDALEKQGAEFRDGRLVYFCCKMLGLYPQLVTAGVPEEKILRLARVIARRQTLYVGAACAGNTSARQILSLIMGCLLMEAMDRKARSKQVIPIVLILEEAPFLASTYTDIFLAVARNYGISVILTGQHSAQFAGGDRDLLTTIRSSCGMKIFFSASQEEREFISGESLDRLNRIWSGQDDSMSADVKESWRHVREPSFSMNRIRRISGTKQHAVLMWNDNGVFTNPRHVFVPYYSKTLADHQRLEMYPFPRRMAPLPLEPAATPTDLPYLAQLTHPDAIARQKELEALQAVLLARLTS